MGWLRKIGRKIGKGIRKLGRKVKKGLKGIVKGIGKLGILGTIAMMFVMPYIPILWTNLGTFASGMTASSSVFARAAGYAMKGIYHAGRVGGRVYSTVTNAISGTLSAIPGVSTVTEGISKAFNGAMDWTRQKLGIGDPTAYYSEASLDYKEFQNIAGKDASLKDFEAWKKTDGYHEKISINERGREIYESMKDPSKFDRTAPTREGTYDKTDVLKKNESFDDFLERNEMDAERFLEMNPDVPTVETTLKDGTVVKTPEITPDGEYNVLPTEKEVIGQVRRARLEGRTVGLEYDVDKNMYKIQSEYDKYIQQGMTPDEAMAEAGRDYQIQFGDPRLRETLRYQSEFKGYARDPNSGSYYKQDPDLLGSGSTGMDAVEDMTIVTPESDPGFFKKLSNKVFPEDKIADVTANVAKSGISNLMQPDYDVGPYNTYGGYYGNKLDVTSPYPLDTGLGGTVARTNIGAAQMDSWNRYTQQENLGYGGGQPSFQTAGYQTLTS